MGRVARMSAVDLEVTGGARLKMYLASMQAAVGGASKVRVGFLEDSTYSEGDGGARLEDAANRLTATQKSDHPSWEPRLKAWAAWQATHTPVLHVAQVAFWAEFGTSTEPSRPYFRNMIAKQSPHWGDSLGNYLTSSEFNSTRALGLMGTEIQDDLKESINSWPADNAELTVHIKGFNRALSDSRLMIRSADFEVLK